MTIEEVECIPTTDDEEADEVTAVTLANVTEPRAAAAVGILLTNGLRR